MLWLSTVLIVGFGGLTLYLHNQRFIQMKPTLYYLLFSGLLFGSASRPTGRCFSGCSAPLFPGSTRRAGPS